MFKDRKIDNFFDKKKRCGQDLSQNTQKTPKNYLIQNSTVSTNTLTKANIDKQLLDFDLDSRYGPSYGNFLLNTYMILMWIINVYYI